MNRVGRGNKIIEAQKMMSDFKKSLRTIEIVLNIVFIIGAITLGVVLGK